MVFSPQPHNIQDKIGMQIKIKKSVVDKAGLPQKVQNQIPGLSRTFLGHFPGLFQDCLRFFYRT